MARARVKSIDQDDVGKSGGDFFKPEPNKQRIALVPALHLKSDLEISDALKEKAKGGDRDAIEDIEERTELKEAFTEGLTSEPPRVKEVTDFGPEKKNGFLFGRADSHLSHYLPSEKISYLCKSYEFEAAGLKATCCDNADRGAMNMYAVVLVVYETDHDGEVIKLKEERQKPLDDDHKLDFKYSLKIWSLSDSRMRAWKEHHRKFPLISSDYDVWTEKQGASDRVKFGPNQGQALWMARGPVLFGKILREGAEIWERAARAIGKDFSIKEIDTMFGVKQGGGVEATATETDYDNLLK